METNINYENIVRSLVNNANQFLSEDIVILEVTDDCVTIEFKNKNLIIKESKFLSYVDDKVWKRLLFECFNKLSEKYAN